MKYNFKKLDSINKLLSIITNDDKYVNMTSKEVIDILVKNDDDILDRWKKSNRTDYSIYQDKSYQLAGLYCYYAMTQRSINETMKYIHNNVPNASELSVFDDYNGIGVSTIYFLLQGLNVSFMNDNDKQIESFVKLCEHYKLELPYNDVNRDNQYDIFLSYEIAEHYNNPIEYLDLITPQIKQGGLFVIAHSMNYPEAPGHFNEYLINGSKYPNKTASRVFNKVIKENFDQVHRGWNGTPLFFRKK